MAFSKNFPKTSDKSVYPKWVEVRLSEEEEKEQEEKARQENIRIMKECVSDAMKIIEENDLKRYQTDLINIATALFEKRAAHEVHHKENKAKEKFDSGNF